MSRSLEERKARAAELHAAGANCAQAVALAFFDLVEDQISEQGLYKIMEGFGLGMGGMEGTCGALSGIIAIAGLQNSSGDRRNNTKQRTYQLSREIVKRFQEKNQAVRCKDLKGVETGTVLRSCPGCIDDAVEIGCAVLGAGESSGEQNAYS